MKSAALLSLLVASLAQAADITTMEDYWIDGKLGVGTTSPGARFEVKAASASTTIFQVSGVDETPFLEVLPSGDVGLSTTPAANMDIMGFADIDGLIGLQLESGNVHPNTGSNQLLFGYAGQAVNRHAWNTVHSTHTENNRLDMLVWSPAVGSQTAASVKVVSLQASTATTASGGGMHISPVGNPTSELVVSNGAITGGGVIHRLSESAPSSRRFKTGIRYFDAEDSRQALDDIKSLQHVQFRYKEPRSPIRPGLIFEEAPASIRDRAASLNGDKRLSNEEAAIQELMKRLEALESELAREVKE